MTRNRADELRTTLTRLTELDPPPPVVVVDNASTDHTPAVVAGLVAARADLRSITLDHNGGGASRNIGVAVATTPYVAFSDDDSWWAQGALPRAEELFETYPRLGLIAARTLVGVEQRDDPVNDAMANSPLGRAPTSPGPSVLGFIACGAIVRVEAFEATGGFSELIGFAGEEETVALDLAAHGWELCYVDDIVNYHHPSPSRSPSSQRQRHQLRNSLLSVWMRRPLTRALRETAALAGRATTDRVAAGALFDATVRLPAALGRRAPLPSDVERRVRLLEGAS